MKYGRPVDCGDGAGIVRMLDVVTAPEPLPDWAEDNAAWLAKQFPTLTGFIELPDGVQPCAFHSGEDFTDPVSYTNPDGSDGNGVFPGVEPEEEPNLDT